MPRFLVLLVGLLCSSPAVACNENFYVCDDPSYEEVWERAATVPVITAERRQLGTDWATTHQNLLHARLGGTWSCVKKMIRSEAGNYNAAFCMPEWMRRVPPRGEIRFVNQDDINRAQRLRRVLYLATPSSEWEYWHLRPVPRRTTTPNQNDCPYTIPSVARVMCR